MAILCLIITAFWKLKVSSFLFPTSGGSAQQPKVLFKRMRHHKGSIYCVAWSHSGNLVATGSNDKLVKLVRFDPDKCNASGKTTSVKFVLGFFFFFFVFLFPDIHF